MSNPFDAYNSLNTNSMSSIGHGYPIGELASGTLNRSASPNYPSMIDIPKWVRKHEGYLANAAWAMGCNPKFIVVMYVPSETLGVSFATLDVVDDVGDPLPMSEVMVKYIFSDKSLKSGLGDIHLGENGELRSAFGVPELFNINKVMDMMKDMYGMWKQFPNETDFNVVRDLNAAQDKYRRMQIEVESKCIESQIEDCRREMEVQRKRIEKLEKEMNKIYEEAADAANFLEEHGIDPNKKDEGTVTVDQLIKVWTDLKAAGWEAVSPTEWTDGKGMTLTMDDDSYHLNYGSKCDYIYNSNGDVTAVGRAS